MLEKETIPGYGFEGDGDGTAIKMRIQYSLFERGGLLIGGFPSTTAGGAFEACFTTRVSGWSEGPWRGLNISPAEGDDEKSVNRNQQKVLGAMGFRGVFLPRQVHGRGILQCGMSPTGFVFGQEGDAVVTDSWDVPLGIMTADCLPVLLYHPSGSAVGAVHAGWRGIVEGIVLSTVDLMLSRWGGDPRDMKAFMGPSIGPCCYMVDKECAGEIARASSREAVAEKGRHKAYVDLMSAASFQLEASGLYPGNIHGAPLCTSCNDDLFFSYRRDGTRTGRMAAVIVLRSPEE